MNGPRFATMICFTLALLLGASGPNAQVPRPDPASTLSKYVDQSAGTDADEAVRLALENNDELLALKKEVEASTVLVDQAEQRASDHRGPYVPQSPDNDDDEGLQ